MKCLPVYLPKSEEIAALYPNTPYYGNSLNDNIFTGPHNTVVYRFHYILYSF